MIVIDDIWLANIKIRLMKRCKIVKTCINTIARKESRRNLRGSLISVILYRMHDATQSLSNLIV